MNISTKILAGPILRRVTATQVYVWLASNGAANYKLELFDATRKNIIPKSCKPILNQQQVGTKKSNLWVSLLQIDLSKDESFPLDELLYYNIVGADLSDVCLQGETLPSFYIPSQLNIIAHGSCRKPHGQAKYDNHDKETEDNDLLPPPDALYVLAQHLNQSKTNLQQRPSHLFLTGDQIYADDVSPDLLAVLMNKAVELIGEETPVPGIRKPSDLCSGERAEKLEDLETGLTSSKTATHLITFGEYAAMYLFVFGNAASWHIETQDKYLRSFIKTLPDIRRALANISTYMIFDDHDVTDDWNLTSNWYDTVRFNPTGRRIVSNAMATYYVFQHIGNSKDALNDDLNEVIQMHLANIHNDKLCEYYDLYLWKHRHWSFSLPTNPPIIVLDTRTQRDFTSKNSAAPLMDRYAVDWLRVTWARLQVNKKTHTPVIISSTPVIGFNPMERAQSIFVRLLSFIMPVIHLFRSTKMLSHFTQAASALDFESWVANKKGFSYFLDSLLLRMKIKKVVFLSGDVHYSFVNKAKYSNGEDTLECLQLTSSAIHNSPKGSDILNGLAVISDQRKDTTVRRGLRPLRFPITSNVFWKIEVKGLMSNSEYDRFLTRRPNVGLVYFDEGEVVLHKLISGTEEKHCLKYDVK
ncbi:MAG: hypothetical protein DSZ29_01155 [Aquificaceae bacterium]|nr:MAG: hypothetical protein DSZ29_01155 [Aquificaceae bacterium]